MQLVYYLPDTYCRRTTYNTRPARPVEATSRDSRPPLRYYRRIWMNDYYIIALQYNDIRTQLNNHTRL